MIKYNSNNINDWYFADDNIIKVYHNNAVCYYKVVAGETAQTPCYAVVDDITQYQDTEFENVFNKADNKWYKLNNLNEYEEYGVYGSGRTECSGESPSADCVTTYDGKLTIDGDYEYQYSGNSWNNVGEISGSSRLPQGYTEVEYIQNTAAVSNVQNTTFLSLAFADSVMGDASGYTYTIVFEPTDMTNTYGNLFGNSYIQNQIIGSSYKRLAVNFANKEKNTANNSLAVGIKTEVKTYWNDGESYPKVDLTNVTASTTTTTTLTGSRTMTNNATKVGLFNFYYTNDSGAKTALAKIYEAKVEDRQGNLLAHAVPCIRESDNKCGFYNLVRNEFEYDESGNLTLTAGSAVTPSSTVYPLYYDEIQDPPIQVSFSSMTEAEQYECPYVGLMATINGDLYFFNDNYQWELIPTFQGKWKATYTGGTTSSAECDSTSAITQNEITISNLESVVIGDCVTSISSYTFDSCTSLTSIDIPNSVTSIGYQAFVYCTSLSSITIPNSVTSIGDGAFYGCRSLNSITIPSGVTSIGGSAFYGCSGLTSITVNATTPPTLGMTVFYNTNNCPIYVPSASLETYKAASGWSDYASRIQAIP